MSTLQNQFLSSPVAMAQPLAALSTRLKRTADAGWQLMVQTGRARARGELLRLAALRDGTDPKTAALLRQCAAEQG